MARTYNKKSASRSGPPPASIKTSDVENAMVDIFMAGVDRKLGAEIDIVAEKSVREWTNRIQPLIDEATKHRRVEVVLPDATHVLGAGSLHRGFESLLQRVAQKWPVMLVGPPAGGKALAIDTPIVTPDGWTTMGELQIGDQVYNENGDVCNVTYVREHKVDDVQYRVTFSDGSFIDACSEHLWISHTDAYRGSQRSYQKRLAGPKSTYHIDRNQRHKAHVPSLLTTQKLKDTLVVNRASGSRLNHAIPVAGALAGMDADLPIDPYTFGVWIGDGFASAGMICGNDPEIFDRVGATYDEVSRKVDRGVTYVRYDGLTKKLRALGVLNNKHIPQQYLRASYQQRLDLLRGLMDTDGHIDTSSGCEITQKSKVVIEGVQELIHTLGMKCSVRTKMAQAQTGEPREVYRIGFRPTTQVFSLPRKTRNFIEAYRPTQNYRYVVSIEPIEPVMMTCIRVDSASHLFLAGKAMVPTHNTFAAEKVAEGLNKPFYAISVGSQTSKTDILGYMSASGEYVRTLFREAYEHGGVFLMDEIDAGNSNVLIVINAALSGHYCPFPDGMVEKHKDFYFIGAANTYGSGADRMFVGRNQLDAATLDRFIYMDWPIDEDLEAHLVENYTHGKKWHNVVKSVRREVEQAKYRIVVSPRATMKGAVLLSIDHAIDDVIESVLLPHATPDQKSILREHAMRVWGTT